MSEERNFPEFFKVYIDLIFASSDKFHQTLQKIRDISDSDSLMIIYEELLEKTNSDSRIRKAVLGTFLIRNLKKLSYSNQIEFLKSSILHQIEFFSNRHLCLLYKYLSNLIEYFESIDESTLSKKEFSEFKSIRSQILMESQNNYRLRNHSVADIKLKYVDNVKENINQIVNREQFKNDLEIVIKNLEEFTKAEIEIFIETSRKSILPYCIFMFDDKEIVDLHSKFKQIINKLGKIRTYNILDYISIRGSTLFKYSTNISRINRLKSCIICGRNPITDKVKHVCETCFNEKLKDFPERYFPKQKAFEEITKFFDQTYNEYDINLGYITLTVDLPFSSKFTVMDLEATGDITKDKSNFIITMGVLQNSKIQIYQLIDYSKNKEFKKVCKAIARKLPRPAVAYNFYQSEARWLNLPYWGWIDIQEYQIIYTENLKKVPKSIKLDATSFEWDDITGKDVISESQLYEQSGDLIHLKKIAYHNFIDLLKEYYLALTNIDVNDYIIGYEYNYLANNLVPIKPKKRKKGGGQNRKKKNDIKSS